MKIRWSIKTGIFYAFVVSLFGLTIIAAIYSGQARREISVFPEGTTNGVVGLTRGHWAVYCVSNHTANSFSYAGAKIDLKTDKGWILDPVLTRTEIGGWIAPPSRVWHDGTGNLVAGGSFHIFFNTPENGSRWRASLRFIRRLPPTVSPALKSNPSVLAALGEATGEILDHPRFYDVRVPADSK